MNDDFVHISTDTERHFQLSDLMRGGGPLDFVFRGVLLHRDNRFTNRRERIADIQFDVMRLAQYTAKRRA